MTPCGYNYKHVSFSIHFSAEIGILLDMFSFSALHELIEVNFLQQYNFFCQGLRGSSWEGLQSPSCAHLHIGAPLAACLSSKPPHTGPSMKKVC